MARKTVSPIMTWLFWGIVVLGVFLIFTWEYFVKGFANDASKITHAIVIFFIYGFFASLRLALSLQGEYRALNRMDDEQGIVPGKSDVAAMYESALACIRKGDRIDVRNLVSAYGMKIKARVDNIAVISGMLITIGLLGTVVGLIITITGLGEVLNVEGSDLASMKSGLNETVSGMGTAFYTTFFGALLGGVVLKVLGSEMKKSATQIVSDALRFGELFIAPQVSKVASNALTDLEARIVVLDGQMQKMGESIGSVIDTIDSKQTSLASGLDGLVDTVARTSEQANERTGALVASVTSAIDESSEQANERLRVVVESVEQSVAQTNEQANERLQAVTGAVEQSVSLTNEQANERLEALVREIARVVEEINTRADERLTTLTGSVEQHTAESLRQADERLKVVVAAVDEAAKDTHRQANARLVELVDTVSQSIEHTRRASEKRLDNKTADLAGKLNEAAAMLAALAVPDASEE